MLELAIGFLVLSALGLLGPYFFAAFWLCFFVLVLVYCAIVDACAALVSRVRHSRRPRDDQSILRIAGIS